MGVLEVSGIGINLNNISKLAEPFDADDIEWRVSRSGTSRNGMYCVVLAYITARAIQKRLDDVCGPQNWRLEEPRVIQINGKSAFSCGISIRIGDEWVTKWDVCEPTNIEPAKGGWSGAMKRAGAQWGIGRYLYRIPETYAEVEETKPPRGNWNYARLSSSNGKSVYYWLTPTLPAWALPKEPEHEISDKELKGIKKLWAAKFAAESKNPADLLEGFTRFVSTVCGDFPVNDYTCWSRDAFERCKLKIEQHSETAGVSSDVPFEA